VRAITYRQYGGPDVLRMEDVAQPVPQADEVVIAVEAAGVNHWDWDLLRGIPRSNRIGAWGGPANPILGSDVAGRIAAVGAGVTDLDVGDAVFGDLSGRGWGCFAELVSAPVDRLLRLPAGLSFTQAAAVPQSGAMAMQGLRGPGRIGPGRSVLINGAGGGMGTFAVQIAAAFGADVTAVDLGHKAEAMRRLGARRTIDYTSADYAATGPYDLIVDAECHRPVRQARAALAPDGRYGLVGGSSRALLAAAGLAAWSGVAGRQRVALVLHRPNRHLDALVPLLQQGRVVPLIDEVLPLEGVPEALSRIGAGQVTGKLVIAVAR